MIPGAHQNHATIRTSSRDEPQAFLAAFGWFGGTGVAIAGAQPFASGAVKCVAACASLLHFALDGWRATDD